MAVKLARPINYRSAANITALDLAKAKLVKKEQEILHDAIYAFTNLIFARETLNINAKNLNLLIRQVENDKIRRDRGQITNTDLAQSESSLAGAQAQFAKSKSDLLISKLNYENIIGNIDDPELVGIELARKLKLKGAEKILSEIFEEFRENKN